MSATCYVPTKGDTEVAVRLGWNPQTKQGEFNPYRIATLRGMYDDEHPDAHLDVSDVENAAKTLSSYRQQLKDRAAKSIRSSGKNLVKSYKSLRVAFTAEEQFNRVTMIASMVSTLLDNYQRNNPNVSRQQLLEGFELDGRKVGGQFAIFDKIYEQLLDRMAQYAALPNGVGKEKTDKIAKVLDNWGPLVTYVRVRLRDTEGVKLGNDAEFASEAVLDNYDDNLLSSLFNLEESVRESWQETNDMRSAFGSIGAKVRSIISMLPQCYRDKSGKIVTEVDDLGFPKMLDAVRVHQQLLDLLRGIVSSEHMMSRLTKFSQTQPWIAPLVSYLQKNPQAKTAFFVDFKKNFQKYAEIKRDVEKEKGQGGLRRYKTTVLNRVRDRLGAAFNLRVSMGSTLDEGSVYDSRGNINWENLRKVRQEILDWLENPDKEENKGVFGKLRTYNGGKSKFYTQGGTSQQRRDFIVNVSRALGIDIDASTASSLMMNKKDLSAYLRNLYEVVQYGIDPALGSENLQRLLKGESLGDMSYRSIVKNSGNSIRFKEKLGKLSTLITKHREGLRVDSRVTRRDSRGNSISLFSNVNPSYMGDKLELIQSYIENNDKAGLRRYLEQEYLSSPYFMYKGKILNKWLEELYKACSDSKPLDESLATLFDYQRFLGTPDLNFEDFTSKQHAIDMIYEFFADTQISPNATTALYPVFILGDSGVSKYIRQRKYTNEEIVDALFDVWQQERRRMELVKASNEYLEKSGQEANSYVVRNEDGTETSVSGKGYSPIDNFSKSASTYSLLQFFNDARYQLSDNPTEQEVKDVIKRYMNDSYQTFINKLRDLGILETKTVTINANGKQQKVDKYVYLDQILDGRNFNDVMSELYANLKFAMIEQLQLMTIDPSFYKGTKDLQKRYKEVHAPGTLLDVSALDFEGNPYSSDGIERCLYFDDIEINAEEVDSEFMEVMKKLYGEKSSVYKKYKENTLTDGQGYRSLTSYRKVLGMAGQWTQEMENAYRKIMEIRTTYGKNPIPASDLAEIEKLAVIFKPIKPYMYTHEQLAVNGQSVLPIPVQHKYAEAVIIPELLPQGSKLRDMAYYMEENNIDLIGSTKICKVGCFGATKIDHLGEYDGEIKTRRKAQGDTNEEITDTERLNFALSQGYVHQLSYNDYRIQTNVPDHVHHSQLFGTQVRKLIMAGVIKYDQNGGIVDPVDAAGHYRYERYVGYNKVNLGGREGMVRLNGRNLIAFYNGLIVANELESYQKFEQAISDTRGLSDRLVQSVIGNSRESIDNLLSFELGEDGNFTVPLFEGSLEHDAAALLFSMYKKLVNKQTINGGSAVQVSAMGIQDYSEDGGLHYVYQYDEHGDPVNILYAECEIPFNLSYKDSEGNIVELDFDAYCNEDGTLKMKGDKPLLEWDFPGITEMIAYRIPTERAYSMINLRVKRFSRKTAGGTIKVPLQGTTIAGFDFDIDKLYFMRREFVATKDNDGAINKLLRGIMGSSAMSFEEYDYSRSPMENTRAARNNMLISLIQQRLMDPETLEQRTTPGGFTNASVSARKMRELFFGSLEGIEKEDGSIDWAALDRRASEKGSDPEPNYDPSDPMTLIVYNQQNQVAGKLIGIFANHNTNHAFASLMRTFRIVDGLGIEFAGHTVMDGYGYDLLHGPKGVDVDLNLAEFLAASVDAVKDPVLNFLNFNTLTADAGALLARVGYNTMEIGLLFNQPIIKEVCEYAFNNGLRLDDAIRDISKLYSEKFHISEQDIAAMSSSVSTVDAMARNILDKRKGSASTSTETYVKHQLQLLNLFKQISTLASEVSQFVTSTKFTAANAVGSTFGDMYAQQMKVENYIQNLQGDAHSIEIELTDYPAPDFLPIKNDEDRLRMSPVEYSSSLVYNPLAYEQAMFDLNRKAIMAMSKYFPYETSMYRTVRDIMQHLTRGKYLDGETINSIHRDIMTYLLSQQERSDFNGELIKHTQHGDMTCREYYTKYFAKDLFTHLEVNPELKEMPIFEYTMFEADEDGNVSLNIQGIGGLAPYQKDAIRDSWSELNRTMPQVARDLFLYNFYKLGFDFSPVSFMNLAPTEVKQSLLVPSEENEARTYVDFLGDVLAGRFGISYDEFAKQYILNHPDNNRLVYQANSREAKKILNPLAFEAGEARSRFVLDISTNKDAASMFILWSDKRAGTMGFVPAIQIGGSIFVANGNGAVFNESTTGAIEYVRMDILGSKQSKNYHSDYAAVPETSRVEQEETPMGDSSIQGDEANSTPVAQAAFDRESVIKAVAHELFAGYQRNGWNSDEHGYPITEESLVNVLSGQTDQDLMELVDAIKTACRENGILMLDNEGNLLQGC